MRTDRHSGARFGKNMNEFINPVFIDYAAAGEHVIAGNLRPFSSAGHLVNSRSGFYSDKAPGLFDEKNRKRGLAAKPVADLIPGFRKPGIAGQENRAVPC